MMFPPLSVPPSSSLPPYVPNFMSSLFKTVAINLWVTTPLGSRIRFPAYPMFTLQFITVEKLQ